MGPIRNIPASFEIGLYKIAKSTRTKFFLFMPGRRCGVIFHQSLAEARDLGTAAMLPTRTSIRSSRERSGVKYNEGAELDPSQMGGGGRGIGGKIAVGGGAGLIVLLLALCSVRNPRHPARRRRDRSRRHQSVRLHSRSDINQNRLPVVA
jgi:hypothetical protein